MEPPKDKKTPNQEGAEVSAENVLHSEGEQPQAGDKPQFSPESNESTPPINEGGGKGIVAILIIIVILVLIAIGVYFTLPKQSGDLMDTEETTSEEDENLSDTSDLEEDMDSLNDEEIDSDLERIDQEFAE